MTVIYFQHNDYKQIATSNKLLIKRMKFIVTFVLFLIRFDIELRELFVYTDEFQEISRPLLYNYHMLDYSHGVLHRLFLYYEMLWLSQDVFSVMFLVEYLALLSTNQLLFNIASFFDIRYQYSLLILQCQIILFLKSINICYISIESCFNITIPTIKF